jgi:hypothetical protein
VELARDNRSRKGERGYLMAALAAAVAVMVIFSMLAFQAWTDVLRRDNEAEMMFRARDLARAIQRYRRDHGGVAPDKLEKLMEPGPRGQYYLRQMWKDPLVKNGKWGLLYIGPGGQIIDPNGETPATGLEDAFGRRKGGSIFDKGNEDSEQRPDVQLPGNQQLPQQQQREFKSISADDPNADPNAAGKQLSGLPIAGVRSMCEDEPFRVYNGLSSYSEWRFTYLDFELAAATRGRQPGQGQQNPGVGRTNPGRGAGGKPTR